ncbi:MAG: tetratricopeptide repeat protein [Janthinobacterium lividum]
MDDLSGIFGNPVIGKGGQRFFRGGAPQIDVVEAMRTPMQAGRLHHWRTMPEGPSEAFHRARIAARHQAVQTRQNTTFYRNRVRECASATAGAGAGAGARAGAGGGAALFFHDSFMTAQSQFWERSFGRTMFAGVSHRVFLDAVDAWRPDLVVSLMVETALFRTPLDHDVWSFADEFECDCRSPAGMQALQALRLYRQMRFTEAADLAAGLPAMTGFNAYHARVAAHALVTDGRFAEAVAMSRLALEAMPGDPSYLWMRAYAELYHGNPADAVILATWAVAADPANAAWSTLLAEVLIGLGRWDDAAGLLERVTPLLDDSQALWRNLAVVRSARGDAAGAAQAERAADAFDAP